MRIEIMLSKEHYQEFCKLCLRGAFHGKNEVQRAPHIAIWSIIFIGPTLLCAGVTMRDGVIAHTMIGAGLGLVIGWLTMVLAGNRINKHHLACTQPADNDPLFHKHAYTFGDDRLEWSNEVSGGYSSTQMLKKSFENERLILLFNSRREAHILPKNQLTEDQIACIRKWASDHLPKDEPAT